MEYEANLAFINLLEQVLGTLEMQFLTYLAAKWKYSSADTLALERQMDQMVYKLYDLSSEEIAIVEGKR